MQETLLFGDPQENTSKRQEDECVSAQSTTYQ